MLNHSPAKNYGSALGYDPTWGYSTFWAMVLPQLGPTMIHDLSTP